MFPSTYAALVEPPLLLARIVAQDRDRYVVMASDGERFARISGKLRLNATEAPDLPVVGDYVAIDAPPNSSEAIVRHILPRANLFARRAAGTRGERQPIAANLDWLFITIALDGDFNLRRIERYLSAAAAYGVPVALALTKLDLAEDVESFVVAAQSVAAGAPVIALCALDGRGLAAFAPFRGPDKTLGFVGSSGVGKSTILNALLGSDRQATGDVRSGDRRGRHTTTRRELIRLADGTAVIDTPGMREFALSDAEDGIVSAFDDVATLAALCRFRDCAHDAEPGCCVRAEMDPERLDSWRRLNREAAFEARKTDVKARLAEEQRWKLISRAQRRHPKYRHD